MPFHQRTVAPRLLCRLNKKDTKSPVRSDLENGSPAGATGHPQIQKPVLFTSLEEVCCHALIGVLHQLSDLSRHAGGIFLEIETEVWHVARRSGQLRLRLETLKNTVRSQDPKKVKIPVSNLDEESKWAVHYAAPWHQQENVFLPTDRPACVEDLHRQAKVNLKNVLRDCDKLRKDGFRSSQYYSQGPTFSGSNMSDDSPQEDEDMDKKSEASSEDEEEEPVLPVRPRTPQPADSNDGAGSGWSKTMPLPTPEERMRQQAQAVQTDIVPINITAVTGHGDLRPHSMYIPGQYSTLGRVGSMNSGLRQSNTRDSSCQTEEVKVVPPSMRRIRAQRGQGIAAQMAASSGTISIASDSTSTIFAPQHNGGSQRFHSLPRQGARISLNFEPGYSSAPYRSEDCSAGALPKRIGTLQADDTTVQLRNSPKAIVRPKSEEVRSTLSEQAMAGPACMVSPHAAYSTLLIPNATLSCSSEVITIHTANSCSRPGTPQMRSVSSYPKDRPLSTAVVNGGSSQAQSATSSRRDSAVSLSTSTEVDSQCSTLNGTKGRKSQDTTSESSYSDGSLQSQGRVAADRWVNDTPENIVPKRPLTSSCSTPTNHIYSSPERSSNKTDASSLHSMDNDGYYTSMHTDSGIRTRSHNNMRGKMRHSMYECRMYDIQDDPSGFYSDRSLSRSISLRKSKKPPLPPARTDSLRRKPGKKTSANGSVLNETLIATLQQTLQMGVKGKVSSSSSQSPCSDYDDPWVPRPRSQSSISAGSSGLSASMANVYYICPVTPSQSDTSSLRSDYTETWGYYPDYPRQHGEQPHSPTSSSGAAAEFSNGSCLPSMSQASLPECQDSAAVVKPKTSSPDRVHRLTSPSSGYSSQSNTPTAGTPVPSGMRSMSPAGAKSKPKVPERKSSLLSSTSVSSSSTSLSSNTSDSAKNPLPPPPPPLPGLHTSPSMSPTFTLHDSREPLFTPPPPPPLPPSIPAYMGGKMIPPLHRTPETSPDMSSCSSSSDFPPPPPELLFDSGLPVSSDFSPPLPPPPPPLPHIIPKTPLRPPMYAMITPAAPPFGIKGQKEALRLVNADFKDNIAKESKLPPMPLITAQALQMVQLRSVKKLEHEGAVTTKAQDIGHALQSIKPKTPEKPQKLEPPNVLSLAVCSSRAANETEMQLSPTKKFGQEAGDLEDTLSETLADYCSDSVSPEESLHQLSPTVPAVASLNFTPKKKPPAVSKKPKLILKVPQSPPQPVSEERQPEVVDGDMVAVLSPQSGLSVSGMAEAPGATQQQHMEDQMGDHSGSSTTPMTQSRESLSSEASTESLQEAKTSTVVRQKLSFLGEKSISDRHRDRQQDSSNTMDSISSKEEENGDIFEDSVVSCSSPVADADVFEDMVTPTRPRTTEDLFAAIHRSKRKVLGRRESEEERSRGHSPSPPVTPTSSSPASASLPRHASSIQRNLRKSATSSDNFKALLLKKGSRSETGFRISATEMLKNTDPRFHRTRSESSLELSSPDSPGGSPSRGKQVAEEWARSEGFSPRFPGIGYSSLVGSRYGRSRTPPSAASSKYNARSRIPSSPMTVICEGDGELMEAGIDCEEVGSPLQDSNGTSHNGNGS
ncbi:NHS-like protein 1 isoform X2 [Paramormyrops kingsleyae]|uniref:NHS-like protein 1 isoform X2 n=1 Tax=Paramormyrops kingsleyae TaxID=1676925 RepID=UPI003B97B131